MLLLSLFTALVLSESSVVHSDAGTQPCDADVVALVDAVARGEHLAEERLEALPSNCLRLVRNAVYARRGRRFVSPDLTAFFSTRPWYRPAAEMVALPPEEEAEARALLAREKWAAFAERLAHALFVTEMLAKKEWNELPLEDSEWQTSWHDEVGTFTAFCPGAKPRAGTANGSFNELVSQRMFRRYKQCILAPGRVEVPELLGDAASSGGSALTSRLLETVKAFGPNDDAAGGDVKHCLSQEVLLGDFLKRHVEQGIVLELLGEDLCDDGSPDSPCTLDDTEYCSRYTSHEVERFRPFFCIANGGRNRCIPLARGAFSP